MLSAQVSSQLLGGGKYCGMRMYISTSCSCRSVLNDSTVDRQPYGSSVCRTSQTYCCLSVSLGAALHCRTVPRSLARRAHFLIKRQSALLFLCRRMRTLAHLRSGAIPRCKHTERWGGGVATLFQAAAAVTQSPLWPPNRITLYTL